MQIIDVPSEFQPKQIAAYPDHQRGPRMAEAIHQYFNTADVKTRAVYLPIYWDDYFVQHTYGANIGALKDYTAGVFDKYNGCPIWSFSEYDDGVLVHTPSNFFPSYATINCDMLVPLLCDRHPYQCAEKTVLASFLGMVDQYDIRKEMRDAFSGPEFEVIGPGGHHPRWTKTFREMMARSKFALCPRGYAPTSYRLYEAMQLGCVPVYISDEHLLPFAESADWSKFCVMVKRENIASAPDLLRSIPDEKVLEMSRSAKNAYEDHFCIESTCRWIHNYLERTWPCEQ
jgi:hypothetical protein